MRLWLIRPRDDVLARLVNPWNPPYDKLQAAVIRASDENHARGLAQAVAGCEGRGIYRTFGLAEDEIAARNVGLPGSGGDHQDRPRCEEALGRSAHKGPASYA